MMLSVIWVLDVHFIYCRSRFNREAIWNKL